MVKREIESLRKILELERAKGYANIAIMGGLDRYFQHSPAQLPNISYSTLSPEERRKWVEKILSQIAEYPEGKLWVPSLHQSDDGQSLDSPITTIKGVSSNLAAKFDKLGVKTIRDMLYFFPRRHLDYSQRRSVSHLEAGAEQTIIATVWQAWETKLGQRRGTEAIVGDETGNVRVVWFNQPYLVKKLRVNMKLAISGKVNLFKGRMVFESPEWEPLGNGDLIHTGRLVPLYPLTEGMRPRTVRRLIKETVDRWAPRVPDFIPRDVRERHQFPDLLQAIKQAHYPDNLLLKDKARQRLAFDELFLIQLGMLTKKRQWQEEQPSVALQRDAQALEKFLNLLPFQLTSAQQKVLEEILSDLEKSTPMSRLLQGEVGSGKTVVATAALLIAAASGYQGALMAPTEILAEQDFDSISELLSTRKQQGREGHIRTCSGLSRRPFTIALLVGGIDQREKQKIQRRIAEGEIDITIGTHALIQTGVQFKRLALAVIDEQHRFGVMQRSRLRQKGTNPHLLVMTATPIPRSLALTIYGDLDLSLINELPPGRQVIETHLLSPEERDKAYSFVRQKVGEGRQVFIICPLIEESENIEAKAAVEEYRRLSQETFPDLRLGLLHGRMNAKEKDDTMRHFRNGELDILVSTPVVEVGIDIPNATVMVVEGADRFGLSQLHQFRGRVGRGKHQSYCLLLSETPSPEARERLRIIERTQDGFILAEEDLRLRGPGEFFGTRQSGLPDLHMAKLSDVSLLELARNEANLLFQQDPKLENPQHNLLVKEVEHLWKNSGEVSN